MTEKSKSPLARYRHLVEGDALATDPSQEEASRRLDALHEALQDYRPPRRKRTLKSLFGLSRNGPEPPKGLYLAGGVGRGKSMLMDLFYETAPVSRKRRVHFHAFMAEIHDRLHARRQNGNAEKADPLPEVARDVAETAWLLCFDELVVENIADAMILGRLFETLFQEGCVVVATSNFAPDRLYEGGLQRDRFLPFIDLLKDRLEIYDLGAGRDYRLDRLQEQPVYYSPLTAENRKTLEQVFSDLTDGVEAQPESLTVKGRQVKVAAAGHGVARLSFRDLCERPLGASDYLALAARYHTVILSGVPCMGADQRNEARRFMHLVDALYENSVVLFMTADGPPEDLYPEGDGTFEFARTVSRLQEMQSREYIEQSRSRRAREHIDTAPCQSGHDAHSEEVV
ncbi:cell division protein ZapE [Fodinicurvata sediminis]|uniref:cell division protein ZapE n=1 Tax=Fodinicurvata sediminis TaxID=1121832 RepID=UPI0004070EC9|nr:cell division protein ZapE [Fodinicurvata sediminis]